jgi:hypothetical protein
MKPNLSIRRSVLNWQFPAFWLAYLGLVFGLGYAVL